IPCAFNGETEIKLKTVGAYNSLGKWKSNDGAIFVCPSTNIGIGTYNPQYPLDVVGDAHFTGIVKLGEASMYLGSLESIIDGVSFVQNFIYTDNGALRINANEGQGSIENTIINPTGGFVGIGTLNPQVWKFTVTSPTRYISRYNYSGNDNISGTRYGRNDQSFADIVSTPNGFGIGVCRYSQLLPISTQNNEHIDFFIDKGDGGYVGIGTIEPQHKLHVAGTIAACEVIIDEDDFCDYVFLESHKLMTPYQRKEYYVANHHLPLMPSEKEIISGGLNVSDVVKGLTFNVEEMALNQLDIYKMIEELTKELEALQAENKKIKEELETLR
ncbi:MAG: hypothetical protein JKY53_01735, partial [Flavobacteriales bacterium]|nr:hypothetical protein [Flavobacteriales bacterium]